MTVKEVAEAFFRRQSGNTTNLTSNGMILTSYYTPVMRWKGMNLCVNEKGCWSATTKKHVSYVYAKVKEYNQNNKQQIVIVKDESVF